LFTFILFVDLIHAGGDAVFINSTQGRSASGGVGQYAASKHALRAVADSLRAEVAGTGLRVCTLYAGRTATPMQEQIFRTEGRAWTPERLLQPDDIADTVITILGLPATAEITDITIRPARKL
jgi:NADP-dependent 3-hydroxy acid dehydrogenase YdfG